MMSKEDETNQIEEEAEEEQPRAFWSGIVAFGLVSLPVSLYPAHRGKMALKMVDAGGTLLRRQFFCEGDNKPLEREDVVRSYEIEKYHYVVVEDEELEALEPKRSREIDLKRFVPVSSINPAYFERAYFLVPDGDTTKAYRLLARSMEEEQRAGIATFVMHGRDYLVAIIAEGGILRAETLRFHDELRTPEQVGLPQRQAANKKTVDLMRGAIKKLMRKQVEAEWLSDPQAALLRQRVEKKLETGADVLKAPEEPVPAEAASNVIDLMQVLKQRLQGQGPAPKPAGTRGSRGGGKIAPGRTGRGKTARGKTR
jgi:DNA end-binding protein Ku